MDNNLQSVLRQILNTSGGTKAANDLKKMDLEDIESKISKMDKSAIVAKLNAMNMSTLAQKVNSMSNDRIVKMIKSNPQIIDLISKL